jgi:hypothetical protein
MRRAHERLAGHMAGSPEMHHRQGEMLVPHLIFEHREDTGIV